VQKGVVWLSAPWQRDQEEQLIGRLAMALALHHYSLNAAGIYGLIFTPNYFECLDDN
jgi:hypothetical protein